jgi:hypothetical protein
MQNYDRRIKRLSTLQAIIQLLLVISLFWIAWLVLTPGASAADSLAFNWPEQEWDISLPLIDTDKLCRGIALAETSGCTAGMALTKNNCHGLMTWRSGTRAGQEFASTDESQAACVDLWNRKYKVFPTMKLASTYTGSDSAARWLRVVSSYYSQ